MVKINENQVQFDEKFKAKMRQVEVNEIYSI